MSNYSSGAYMELLLLGLIGLVLLSLFHSSPQSPPTVVVVTQSAGPSDSGCMVIVLSVFLVFLIAIFA
jgi:hypothetical protein